MRNLLYTIIFTVLIGSGLIFAVPAYAHIIVHPSTAGIGSIQEFTMSIPTEKDNPTVAVKLLIPDGLLMVVPNVKSGWTIKVKKQNDENSKVTEIDWTGGTIPPEQRDIFSFQAQVPAKETTLKWKAYQTYQDGSVVAWDHAPTSNPTDDSAPPPYSITKVINDLAQNANMDNKINLLMFISVAGLIFSMLAVGMQVIRRK